MTLLRNTAQAVANDFGDLMANLETLSDDDFRELVPPLRPLPSTVMPIWEENQDTVWHLCETEFNLQCERKNGMV